MDYKFPEITFSQTATFAKQLDHLLSEFCEVCMEDIKTGGKDYTDEQKEAIMFEVLDVMQSAESLCRVYARERGDLDALELEHYEKDRIRGYHIKAVE